jgi:hypothetical protein
MTGRLIDFELGSLSAHGNRLALDSLPSGFQVPVARPVPLNDTHLDLDVPPQHRLVRPILLGRPITMTALNLNGFAFHVMDSVPACRRTP